MDNQEYTVLVICISVATRSPVMAQEPSVLGPVQNTEQSRSLSQSIDTLSIRQETAGGDRQTQTRGGKNETVLVSAIDSGLSTSVANCYQVSRRSILERVLKEGGNEIALLMFTGSSTYA